MVVRSPEELGIEDTSLLTNAEWAEFRSKASEADRVTLPNGPTVASALWTPAALCRSLSIVCLAVSS